MLRAVSGHLHRSLAATAIDRAALGSVGAGAVAARRFAAEADSSVVEIKDSKHFDDLVTNEPRKLAVVDFTAVWCGPCRVIAPVYAALSKAHPEVTFTKVDIDNADVRSVVEKHQVTGVPTFVFYKGGKQINSFTGVQRDKLLQLIEQHK
uniref:Thioredoxin domain-containing protein n=1 Tax=Chlamydomonas euryale TaxID=1486919 RepID=A0A7R9VTW2_9CHLO|mmetsp:Transcript_45153/g.134833  ORF Transcript_45153/g.134833 Transcript_45153/m.134833 type:complete len:150 (+) Transcript_45153:170-619(+)